MYAAAGEHKKAIALATSSAFPNLFQALGLRPKASAGTGAGAAAGLRGAGIHGAPAGPAEATGADTEHMCCRTC